MNEPSVMRDMSWRGRTRDRVARAIANFALEHIATPWYRAMVGGSIRLGTQSAVRGEDA